MRAYAHAMKICRINSQRFKALYDPCLYLDYWPEGGAPALDFENWPEGGAPALDFGNWPEGGAPALDFENLLNG